MRRDRRLAAESLVRSRTVWCQRDTPVLQRWSRSTVWLLLVLAVQAGRARDRLHTVPCCAGSWSLLRLLCPQVLRDSYFWGARVTSAAVTTTPRGITSKSLLFGTAAGQV